VAAERSFDLPTPRDPLETFSLKLLARLPNYPASPLFALRLLKIGNTSILIVWSAVLMLPTMDRQACSPFV
jgi:hypothetical protein